jgi:ubiquinone/menaquinone biosynthesis C-methylase UbiE
LSLATEGADKYHGEIATGYDAKRDNSPKRVVEERIIKDMLADLPAGSWVLDCPVGTGFLLPYYIEKGFQVWALDKSEDMLQEARQKVRNHPSVRFYVGDVRNLRAQHDKSVDASLAIRITRWLSPEECQQMMRELQRVTRQRIIITARVANHPHVRPVELFTSVLDGWHLNRSVEGYQPEYRVLEFQREGDF